MYRAKTNNGTSVKRFESYSPSHFIRCTLNDEYEWVRFVSTHISYIFFSFRPYTVIWRCYHGRCRRCRLLLRQKCAGFMCSFHSHPQMATMLSCCLVLCSSHAVWIRAHTKFIWACVQTQPSCCCVHVCGGASPWKHAKTDSPICVCIGMCIRENSTAALYPNRFDFGQEFSLEKGFFIVSNDSCLQQSDTYTINCSRLRRQ